ncbi:MAG: hypothetical protein F4Z31_22220 [Gemmatimonadetes bacterium]|nr:hypothetical protein [Gemmatimonadota bacterium]
MAKLLDKEVSFYESHRGEFEKRYPGRYLLIHGRKLHGDYASFEKAVKGGVKRFGEGPFLVLLSGDQPQREFFVPTIAYGVPIQCG